MRRKITFDNYNGNLYKSVNINYSNLDINTITNKQENALERKDSFNKINKEYKCKFHNRNFDKYCIMCKQDICPNCYKEKHFIHDIIKYKDILLNNNQFELLKKEYNDYIETFSNILIKIKKWQKIFNKSINELDQYVNKNIIEVINKMINNYDINKLNYNTIIEYRLIYSLLLSDVFEKTNNEKIIKIMKSYIGNYPKYQYIDEIEDLFSLSKENISQLNTSFNKGNFIEKGNNIIKFLSDNISLFSDFNEVNDNLYFENFGNNYIKSRNNTDKIPINNKSAHNIFNSILSRKLGFFDDNNIEKNNKQIYEKKKAFDKRKSGEIFLGKEDIAKFEQNQTEVNIHKNSKQRKSNSLYSIESPQSSIFTKKEENKTKFGAKNNPLWNSMNFFSPINSKVLKDNEDYDDYSNIDKIETDRNSCYNKRPIIFNNNINNYNNISNINNKNNYINSYNINNQLITERNLKSKIYHHKKYNRDSTGFKSVVLNKCLTDRISENNIFNTFDLHNFDTYSLSNTISLTESKIPSSNNSNKNKVVKTNLNATNSNLKIKKVNKFIIDINKDLNIGFELGNSECKIGIINQNSNCIELWVPYIAEKNNSSIPTLISFKENNDDIMIGNNAQELKISNPSYTIFNIIKFIGKNSKEVEGKKELWPYKIYTNVKTDKPYIKGCSTTHKNKAYNFEDLLSLYLRKLFELLFNEIEFKKNNNNNLIKINLVVTVPNNFTYLQRKIIEKIFQTQIFKKGKNINNNNISNYYSEKNKNSKTILYSFGKFNIQIKNIKIENSSNIGYLYLYQKQIENNFKRENKNIILIHIEGSSINISLISTLIKNSKETKNKELNNKYEIKGINGTLYGEDDFTDIFMDSFITDFTEKIRDKYRKNLSILANLRKSFENAKKHFYKKYQTEISFPKLYDVDIKMTLNKSDYERACDEQFQKITELIKDILFKSSTSEKEIDDIIFIGNTTNINILKQRVSKIFKGKNNELFDKLTNSKYFQNDNDIINEDYIVIGATLQSFNLFSKIINKYKYIEMSPISFGIETLNKKMDFIIEKGNLIPKEINKSVKIPILQGTKININIYEGEDEFVSNNTFISSVEIDINNLKNEKKEKDYIEILIQFIIDANFNLNVFILDNKTLKRKFECIINIDIVRG